MKIRRKLYLLACSLATMILLSLVSGCGTASLDVKHLKKAKDGKFGINHRSIYYSLPKTELLLTRHFTNSIEYYQKGDVRREPLSVLCRAVADPNVIGSLSSIQELINVEVKPKIVPDPDAIYAIELNAGYFENYNLTLDLSEFGIINSVDAKVVDQTDQITLDTASALIGALAPFAVPGASFAAPTVASDNEKISINGIPECKKIETKAKVYLADLENARRNLYLNPPNEILDNSNLDSLSTQYDNEVRRIQALLGTKTLNSTSITNTLTLPDFDKLKDSPTSQFCEPIAAISTFELCVNISSDQMKHRNIVTESQNELGKENKGLRYRTPALVEVVISENKKELQKTEIPITQYGPTITLPASLGNRTASYKLDLYDLTSAVEKFTIDSTGSNPDAVSKALSGAISEMLKTSQQRDKIKLEKEIDILTLMKKKKDAEAALGL